jgi:hypothetical protein
MSEEPLRECTVCGAAAERLLSAGGGLLFKGSGFYITDYRSDSYRKAAEADSGAKPAATGSDTGGASSKSEGAGAGAAAVKPSESSAKQSGAGGGKSSSPKDSGGSSSKAG